MRPQIENLNARIAGFKLNSYQRALSKKEFMKLLEYIDELENIIDNIQKDN